MRTPSTPLSSSPQVFSCCVTYLLICRRGGCYRQPVYNVHMIRKKEVHRAPHFSIYTMQHVWYVWYADALILFSICDVPERLHKLDYFAKMLCRCAQMVEICAKAGVCFWAHPAFSREKIPLVTQFKLAPSVSANHQFNLSPFCPRTSLRSVESQPPQPADGVQQYKYIKHK